jgi:hypothetical protein
MGEEHDRSVVNRTSNGGAKVIYRHSDTLENNCIRLLTFLIPCMTNKKRAVSYLLEDPGF